MARANCASQVRLLIFVKSLEVDMAQPRGTLNSKREDPIIPVLPGKNVLGGPFHSDDSDEEERIKVLYFLDYLPFQLWSIFMIYFRSRLSCKCRQERDSWIRIWRR